VSRSGFGGEVWYARLTGWAEKSMRSLLKTAPQTMAASCNNISTRYFVW